jgi:hypothetical protein
MAGRQPFASPDFVELSLWNYGAVTYPTDPPGGLTIGQGEVKARYRLDFDHGGDPNRIAVGPVNVACIQRVADSAGAVWEARTCFSPRLFVHRLLDLRSFEGPRWEHSDPERAGAIAAHPLITGLSVIEDDRFYRRFWVDDALVELIFKYQGLTIDVGYQDEMRVVVRVGGFFGSWSYVPLVGDCEVPVWRGGPAAARRLRPRGGGLGGVPARRDPIRVAGEPGPDRLLPVGDRVLVPERCRLGGREPGRGVAPAAGCIPSGARSTWCPPRARPVPPHLIDLPA